MTTESSGKNPDDRFVTLEELREVLMAPVDRGINEDGSLRPGIYDAHELPVSIWTDEEREKVDVWTSLTFGIEIQDIQSIEVGKYFATFVLYHRDEQGHIHVETDCDEDGDSDSAHVYTVKHKL